MTKKKYVTSIDRGLVHNTHLLIPIDLYKRARFHARMRGMKMTEFVIKALEVYIDNLTLDTDDDQHHRSLKP